MQALVAQWTEQECSKLKVVGSNPTQGTMVITLFSVIIRLCPIRTLKSKGSTPKHTTESSNNGILIAINEDETSLNNTFVTLKAQHLVPIAKNLTLTMLWILTI